MDQWLTFDSLHARKCFVTLSFPVPAHVDLSIFPQYASSVTVFTLSKRCLSSSVEGERLKPCLFTSLFPPPKPGTLFRDPSATQAKVRGTGLCVDSDKLVWWLETQAFSHPHPPLSSFYLALLFSPNSFFPCSFFPSPLLPMPLFLSLLLSG